MGLFEIHSLAFLLFNSIEYARLHAHLPMNVMSITRKYCLFSSSSSFVTAHSAIQLDSGITCRDHDLISNCSYFRW